MGFPVPVIVIKELGHAVPLAKALVAGGLSALELTPAGPAALQGAVLPFQTRSRAPRAGREHNAEQFLDAGGSRL